MLQTVGQRLAKSKPTWFYVREKTLDSWLELKNYQSKTKFPIVDMRSNKSGETGACDTGF